MAWVLIFWWRETGPGTQFWETTIMRKFDIFAFLSHFQAKNKIFNHRILLSKVHAIIYENFIFGDTIPLIDRLKLHNFVILVSITILFHTISFQHSTPCCWNFPALSYLNAVSRRFFIDKSKFSKFWLFADSHYCILIVCVSDSLVFVLWKKKSFSSEIH